MALDFTAVGSGFVQGLAAEGVRQDERKEKREQFDLLLGEKREARKALQDNFDRQFDLKKSSMIMKQMMPVMHRFNKTVRMLRSAGQPHIINTEGLEKASVKMSEMFKSMINTDLTGAEIADRLYGVMLQKDKSISEFFKSVDGGDLRGNAKIALEKLFSTATAEDAKATFRQFGKDLLDKESVQDEASSGVVPSDISQIRFGQFLTPNDLADLKARGKISEDFVTPGLALKKEAAEAELGFKVQFEKAKSGFQKELVNLRADKTGANQQKLADLTAAHARKLEGMRQTGRLNRDEENAIEAELVAAAALKSKFDILAETNRLAMDRDKALAQQKENLARINLGRNTTISATDSVRLSTVMKNIAGIEEILRAGAIEREEGWESNLAFQKAAASQVAGKIEDKPIRMKTESSIFDDKGDVKQNVMKDIQKEMAVHFEGSFQEGELVKFGVGTGKGIRYRASVALAEQLLKDGYTDTPTEAVNMAQIIDFMKTENEKLEKLKASPLDKPGLFSRKKKEDMEEVRAKEIQKLQVTAIKKMKQMGLKPGRVRRVMKELKL